MKTRLAQAGVEPAYMTPDQFRSFIADEMKEKVASPLAKKEPKIKKKYLGKAIHFYPKATIGQFLIEDDELKIGDKILIKGSTTGEQQMIIDEMFVNGLASTKAISGDNVTFKLPFRIRLSDKLYKIV
jgi:UPF0176 protein